jgi:Zinc-finger associated domain (zf-AD)
MKCCLQDFLYFINIFLVCYLQIHEEDSLPKIICNNCVDKIESFYEFRESCINAEAMLDSYFTSMKYSEDLAKDGKVKIIVKFLFPVKNL